jgi:Na+/melibiose symporter-like transporter
MADLTDMQRARQLPWLIAGDVLTSVFCSLTVFGSVFILFLSELGLDKTRIGLLLSVIPFCGLVSPLVASQVARFGFKRTFVLFWGARKVIVGFLLLTPAVLAAFGTQGAFAWVGGIIVIFALCRAIAETGVFPWMQEVVPNSIRGKFAAVDGVLGTLATMAAVAVASYLIGRGSGLGGFLLLIAGGGGTGLIAVGGYSRVARGAPLRRTQHEGTHADEMAASLRDRNFLLYMAILSLVTLAWTAFTSFMPLFMREQVGLKDGTVVLVSLGSAMGSLLSFYLWGWTSDRYGSKPVMLLGLYLMAFAPLLWFLMPRGSAWSGAVAMVLSFLAGLSSTGWNIGAARYLYVQAVPVEKKTGYMAVYYAWSGLSGGLAPLLAGLFLDLSKDLKGQFGIFALDAYTPLFAVSLGLLVWATLALHGLHDKESVSFRRLIGLLMRRSRRRIDAC